MASGLSVPHQQVEHMTAPTSLAEASKKSLPTESRPHMDPERNYRPRRFFGSRCCVQFQQAQVIRRNFAVISLAGLQRPERNRGRFWSAYAGKL